MLGNRRLIIDTFCEVYDQLRPWADAEFWDFDKTQIVPNAIYVIGREQGNLNQHQIKQLIESDTIKVVLSSPAEGSETVKQQTEYVGYGELIRQGRMLLIGGGDMESQYHHLRYDSFLPKVFDYEENVTASQTLPLLFSDSSKPYKFLFLNGRSRPHRKFLLESFQRSGLLDQCLWTNLDLKGHRHHEITLFDDGKNLMTEPFPIKYLPKEYEVERYQNNLDRISTDNYVKNDLFYSGTNPGGQAQFEWGEIYLKPKPYIDTYFSLVSETVFTYPYSFRTEKIWKPIAIGHPWIAVSNFGYYRDMHALGFKSFGNLIDEKFDLIYNNVDRLSRIRDVVEDLCQSDYNLKSFLQEARSVCEYNQQHLWTMRDTVRKEFPDRFKHFLITNGFVNG
jgi:hypothetical protein